MERVIDVICIFLCFSMVFNYQPTVLFDITCEENSMTAHFSVNESEDVDNTYNTSRILNVTLLDDSCADSDASRTSSNTVDDVVQLNITTDYDECNTGVYNLTDTFHLNNSATLKITETLRDGNTQRVYYYTYNMSCVLDRELNVTSGNYSVDYSTKNITDVFDNQQDTNFTYGLEIKFYETQDFITERDSTKDFNINEDINAEVVVDTLDTMFKMIVQECALIKSETYDDATADVFLQNRSPLDPTFQYVVLNDTETGFSIQAFSFVEDNDVYMQCKVLICLDSNMEPRCTFPPQSGEGDGEGESDGKEGKDVSDGKDGKDTRRRRDTDGNVDERIATSPIIRYNTNVDCGDIKCGINSKCVPLQPARCICDNGYVSSRIESKCVNERIVQIENIHLNKEWKETYADPNHPDFLRLALRYEDILYKSFISADATSVIKGVRIISASPGSIVLTTGIIYAQKSSPQEAYDAFIKSITSQALDATTVRRELQLLTDRTPSIMEIQKKMADIQKLTLIIIVVVLLLVVLMSGIVIIAIRRNRKTKRKLDVDGVDNGGLEMKQPS